MINILIFLSQVIFNILRVLEIRYTYQNKVSKLLINTVFINLVSLLSVYFSLDGLINGNWVVILFYISGSVAGKWVGMKLNNPKKEIWQKIFITKDE
jgi:hypothetical protein